jgi:hypothetical protein
MMGIGETRSMTRVEQKLLAEHPELVAAVNQKRQSNQWKMLRLGAEKRLADLTRSPRATRMRDLLREMR